MLQLKFNKGKLSTQQLKDIEKIIIQQQSAKVASTTTTSLADVNVLHMNTTELFAHVLNLLIKINAHQMLGLTLSQLLDFIVDVANQYHFFQRTSATTTATASESHKILPLYHTFYHAADVMTMLHYFCHDLKANEFLTDMDRVCLMVAALCHDIGHPGLNNHFQVSMKTELAKQFGDKSTLEMYSVYLTIKLLGKHEIYYQRRGSNSKSGSAGGCNNNNTNSKKSHVATALEREKFIETIRDFILSTDMMYHQELESLLHSLSSEIKQKTKPSLISTAGMSHAVGPSTKKRTFATAFCLPPPLKKRKQQKAGETAPAVLNEKGRFDLCRILLHAADISNMTRPWSIAKQWSDLVVQEFYLQGDEEKKNQKTVSPGMDRDSNTQASISLKFGSFIHPFFEALAHLLPASYILVDYLSSNRLLWETAAGNTEHMSKKRKISSSGDTCSTHLLPNHSNNHSNNNKHKRSSIMMLPTVKAGDDRRCLGYRSYSYPSAVCYATHTPTAHTTILEKTNLVPILEFNPPTFLYHPLDTNATTSIVFYHPYDF